MSRSSVVWCYPASVVTVLGATLAVGAARWGSGRHRGDGRDRGGDDVEPAGSSAASVPDRGRRRGCRHRRRRRDRSDRRCRCAGSRRRGRHRGHLAGLSASAPRTAASPVRACSTHDVPARGRTDRAQPGRTRRHGYVSAETSALGPAHRLRVVRPEPLPGVARQLHRLATADHRRPRQVAGVPCRRSRRAAEPSAGRVRPVDRCWCPCCRRSKPFLRQPSWMSRIHSCRTEPRDG